MFYDIVFFIGHSLGVQAERGTLPTSCTTSDLAAFLADLTSVA